MISALAIIYSRLYRTIAESKQEATVLSVPQAIQFLNTKQAIDPHNVYYAALISEVVSLKAHYIEPIFVERFCLARLSEVIMMDYPINVAEAFALSFVLLNSPVDKHYLHFKLGYSGLLNPMKINGKLIEDVEAISQFVLRSLYDAELINVKEDFVLPGPELKIQL